MIAFLDTECDLTTITPAAFELAYEFPPAFTSVQHIREQNTTHEVAMGRLIDPSTQQTICLKDAILESPKVEGENSFTLFRQQGANLFDIEASITRGISQSQPAFDGFLLEPSSGIQLSEQYPFIAHAGQQSSVPLLSIGSMAPSRVDSAETSLESHNSPQRPTSTSADGGTYTCTYHGCKLRFDTPALLQKHKREGHRQAHRLGATRNGDSVGMTLCINSQAGPHWCNRINPSTGKPCNTIFSRPYDLTRHEDTIHNAKKKKVRCGLCTDEKTFKRADALTRHYRVCHPDVEIHGKYRRRGARAAKAASLDA